MPVEEFAAEIARALPGDLDLVYPLASGSEAVEAALKLARQYWVESGQPAKHKILALAPCYHGNTLLALSASAREHYKTSFTTGWWRSSACRRRTRTAATAAGVRRSARAAAARRSRRRSCARDPTRSRRSSPSRSAAPPPARRCPRRTTGAGSARSATGHDVLFVADEVLTGAGRTGTWSALEPYGVVPDIMVLGKGIAGGYVPLSAVVAPRRLVDVLARGSGALLHAQTFSHHATLCAAGVATLRYLRRASAGRALRRRWAAVLHARLPALRELPLVGDVRGRGLLAGIEFVADTATRQPFPRAVASSPRAFAAAALEAGLVVWPNVGPGRRHNGDLAMLAPPFIVTEDEIDEIVQRFGRALARTTSNGSEPSR